MLDERTPVLVGADPNDPLKLMAFVRTLEGAQFTPAGVLKVPLRSPANNPAGLIEELKTVLQELTAPEPVVSGN